ncbi:MAG TPA: hypothetical protein VIG32_06990 [Candidatus Baltobacteraceae bacterium]
MSYASEARALDTEILRVIDAWSAHERSLDDASFDDLALRVFAHQLAHNAGYARYCASLGVTRERLPRTWEQIPAVPSGAFKEAALTTFDPHRAALAFTTSGTTAGLGGRHYMETSALYDAALLAGFDRYMLADRAALRYLNLVPNPADRPDSSLGYMMARVAAARGDGRTGWFVRGDDLFFDAFVDALDEAIARGAAVCIAATAFALVGVLDLCARRHQTLALPDGSRIMETGGFKGRARVVERDELYDTAARRFAVPRAAIVAEYGMTELTSQYYDSLESRAQPVRVKVAPPWLRARVVGPDGTNLPKGTVGALVHVDLANRSSCVAIATEDLGVEVDGGFVLIGRERGAALRGCSLDAEELRATVRL